MREAADRARQLATKKSIQLGTDIDEMPADVNGDAALLQRFFFILIEDAAFARNGNMGIPGRS